MRWTAVGLAVVVPVLLAATSPFLAYRSAIYIAGGFAGIAALALLLVQPLLAAGLLPGLDGPRGRLLHRWMGAALVLLVVAHVAGLWMTSPPDMIDALLFASPTPFSAWGVIAMWALFGAAALAAVRRRVPFRIWRKLHGALASVIVTTAALHAVLIEGAMEPITKLLLCLLVCLATLAALVKRRVFSRR